jgi:hypothetical protein
MDAQHHVLRLELPKNLYQSQNCYLNPPNPNLLPLEKGKYENFLDIPNPRI